MASIHQLVQPIAERLDDRAARELDRAADVAERDVDQVSERMHRRRLAISDDDEGTTTMRDEVAGRGLDPPSLTTGARVRRGAARVRHGCVERRGERVDLAWPNREPMIGEAPGRTRSRLRHVETRGGGQWPGHVSPAREVACPADGVRHAGHEVGVERNHDVGAVEAVLGLERPAEHLPRPVVHGAAIERRVEREARAGVPCSHPRDQLLDQRRALRMQQEPEPRHALAPGELAHQRVQPRRRATVERRPRAVWIVEIEERGLVEGARAAEARRMLGVALDLDRPRLERRYEQAGREPVEDHRGRVGERHPGRHLGWLLDARHDPFGWRLHATGQLAEPGQRRARREQLDHRAAIQIAERLVLTRRELGGERRSRQHAQAVVGGALRHRWHAVQVVSCVMFRGNTGVGSNISSVAVHESFASGGRWIVVADCRWQSRHHPMVSGCTCITRAMRPTSPWQSAHGTPRATWTE
jgi:hypothetical protein